jgi:hypothetical protein
MDGVVVSASDGGGVMWECATSVEVMVMVAAWCVYEEVGEKEWYGKQSSWREGEVI